MAYFVTCTFDLKNATRTDYDNAYADLARIGLKKAVVSSDGKNVVAPTTMTMGEFNGLSVSAVRDGVRDQVASAFRTRRLTSEIFVVAADNWAWGGSST